MFQTQRQLTILQRLKEDPTLSTKQLAKEFNVSEMTIRRDFNELYKQGLIVREHGGALLAQVVNQYSEARMSVKLGFNKEAKQAMAIRVSEMVKDGDCIFLDGGTTSLAVLPFLASKQVTVVVHSDLTLASIKEFRGELVFLGGTYNFQTNCCAGPVCIDTLSRFNFDYAMISCTNIDILSGKVYTADTSNAQIKSFAMKQSTTKILICDATKFNSRGFYEFANVSDFDFLVSNYSDLSELNDKAEIVYVEVDS